ncbi:TLC domain-containing protein 4-B-like [Argopecten irradians]|uniref:TLC domain-containing protein 4-B-like n=1 Tax=Argopecten irradians TaxID=31199 RepID=UPI0037205BAA
MVEEENWNSAKLDLQRIRKIFPVISTKISKSYINLTLQDKHNWNFRFVSCYHSVLVIVIWFYTLLYDEVVSNDPVWSDRPLIRMNYAVVTGFFIADLISLILDYKQTMTTVKYYIHHIASIVAGYYVFTYGLMSYFANLRLMAVFSTLFLNIWWMLDKANVDKSSTVYVLHRHMAIVTFMLTRVVAIPFHWYTAYTCIRSEDFAVLGNRLHMITLTYLPLDILNVHWGIGIIKSACKGSLSSSDKSENGISKTKAIGKKQ